MMNTTITQAKNKLVLGLSPSAENQKVHSSSTHLAWLDEENLETQPNRFLNTRRIKAYMQARTLTNGGMRLVNNTEPRARPDNAIFVNATDSYVEEIRVAAKHVVSPDLLSTVEHAQPLTSNSDLSELLDNLNELRVLQNGWLDGIGSALCPQGLDWLQQSLTENFEDSPIPHVYPTPEGGVQFEWDIGSFRPSLEIDLETHVGEWHCLELGTDESYDHHLQLGNPRDWNWLANELHCLQRKSSELWNPALATDSSQFLTKWTRHFAGVPAFFPRPKTNLSL